MKPTDTSITEEYFLLDIDLKLSEDILLWQHLLSRIIVIEMNIDFQIFSKCYRRKLFNFYY